MIVVYRYFFTCLSILGASLFAFPCMTLVGRLVVFYIVIICFFSIISDLMILYAFLLLIASGTIHFRRFFFERFHTVR